jgi:signal transduction histidine kinase
VALESLIDRAPVCATLEFDVSDQPPATVSAAAYYAVSEALTNVFKHAHAANVAVRVAQEHRTIIIEVVDDGCGGANSNKGTGLLGIADRVATVGGALTIHSPKGAGTRFRVKLPCA